MTAATILFADNAPAFLKTRSEFLEAEGYWVIPATNPVQARKLLEQGGIDLAILDIRLEDDEDEKDISGMTLAKEVARTTPKIILTDHSTFEAVREAFKPQMDGLPAAVEFISKQEGTDVLIQAIERALGPDATWLRKVKQAIDETEGEIRMDHRYVRWQSYIFFGMTLVAITVGTFFLFQGIFFASSGKLDVVIASTIAGILTNAIGYLFFQRVDLANQRIDLANQRIDRYHQERVEGQRFQTLLQACNGLNTKQERENCRKHVISTATGKWLQGLKDNQE